MLLAEVTPPHLTLSIFLLLLNVPLFIYGAKKQGTHFTVYAVYAVFIYSLSAYLITDVLPIDVSFASPLAGENLLLCALFGGMISGVGSGLAFSEQLYRTIVRDGFHPSRFFGARDGMLGNWKYWQKKTPLSCFYDISITVLFCEIEKSLNL